VNDGYTIKEIIGGCDASCALPTSLSGHDYLYIHIQGVRYHALKEFTEMFSMGGRQVVAT